MNIRTKEVCCPRCNIARAATVAPIRHVAGNEGDGLLWFTCGRMKYELPDSWPTLGTTEAIRVARMSRPFDTACMACGRMVGCTNRRGGGGATRWVCYRCDRTGGTVGWYIGTLRDNYDPAEDVAHVLPDPDVTDLFADAVYDGAAMADGMAADLFAVPTPPEDETLEDAIRRELAENRVILMATDPTDPTDPILPLTIPPDSPFHDRDVRAGSTLAADRLGRPEDIPGTSLRARFRRADLRIARFMAGLD